MHFTVIQIIIMFLIGYVCLYALIDRVMNYCRSELDFGAVTMQWFKRTAKSPKYH